MNYLKNNYLKIKILKRGFMLVLPLFLAIFSIIKGQTSESIQGKSYSDRTNGVYDDEITNEMIEDFLNKLKEAIKSDDPKKVSDFISYPCRLNQNQSNILIKNKEHFISLYEKIFDDSLKNLVLKITVDDLFVNYQGFMIGCGQIWFVPEKGIITFNIGC